MINCPECKKEISQKATQCPNCNHPISKGYNTKLLIIFPFICLIAYYFGQILFN